MDRRGQAIGMRDGYLRGSLSRPATQRQMDVLAAFVSAGGSVPKAAKRVAIRPSTVKRQLADLRARFGLSTEQLIYAGRAAGWLVVPSLEPGQQIRTAPRAAITRPRGVVTRPRTRSPHQVAVHRPTTSSA